MMATPIFYSDSDSDTDVGTSPSTQIRTSWFERIDVDKLAYICNHGAELKEFLSDDPDDPTYDPLKIPRKILAKCKDGMLETEYFQPTPNGRYYVRGSLGQQTMARQIRHTVAGEYYTDFDIVNAHPVILEYLCGKHNIPCTYLAEYNADRDGHVAAIQKKAKISRAEAKTVVLSMMNGGQAAFDKLDKKTKWLKYFKAEVDTIHKGLIDTHGLAYTQHVQKRVEGGKTYNHPASFCNILLCQTENKLLQTMVTHCISTGLILDDCVWAFDGFQMPKDPSRDDEQLCRDLEAAALDEHKIAIQMKVKPMDEVIPLPEHIPSHRGPRFEYYSDHHESIVGQYVNEADVKTWVDNAIIYVDKGGNSEFYTRDLTVDPLTKEPSVTFERVGQKELFATLNKDAYITNPNYDESISAEIDEMKPAARKNLDKNKLQKHGRYLFNCLGKSSPGRKGYMDVQLKKGSLNTYSGIDFVPFLKRSHPRGFSTHGKFNMWSGFPLESIPLPLSADFKTVWLNSHTRKHWRTDLCNNNRPELNHFETFVADMLQKPSELRGVCHVFQSGQGTGKSLTGYTLGRLVGVDHSITFGDMETYFQRFNADQANKLLKIFEEISDKGPQLQRHNKLKYELMATTKRIEFKNGSILHMRHSSRGVFITNERNSVYVECGDRRYTFHSVSMEHAQQWHYFAPLWAEAKDTIFMRAMFEYFATMEYNVRDACTVFDTRYKYEQKIRGLSNSLKFMVEFVETGFGGVAATDDVWYSKAAVWGCYKEWCRETNVKPTTQAVFDEQIQKVGVNTTQKHAGPVFAPITFEEVVDTPKQGKRIRSLKLDREALRDGFRELLRSPNFTFNTAE